MLRVGKVYGCATALTIAELARRLNRSILVLTTNVAEAESLETQLEFFLGNDRPVAFFPDPEVLPYDAFSPHQDIISRRLQILRDLNDGSTMTLIAAAGTLLSCLPPINYLRSRGITITVGQDLNHADLIFVIGANPASNHPRFLRQLMACRRRGGKVVVINPAKEKGLVKEV